MDVLWVQSCMFAVLLVAVNSHPMDVPSSRNGSSETDKIPPVVQVFNGSPVKQGTIPGLAFLIPIECGGSLIAQNFVLTAAHCFDGSTPAGIPNIRIYLNTVVRRPLDSESVVRSIGKLWLHPDYATITPTQMYQNDIALIKLDQPVRNLPFVPIATQVGNLDGQAAAVYGFGITQTFNPNPGFEHLRPPSSNIMRRGEGTIMDKDICDQSYIPIGLGSQIFDKQYMCLSSMQDSCPGDSGGPLIVNGLQVGIVSFGIGGCNPVNPDVYTNVAVYANWIRETVANA